MSVSIEPSSELLFVCPGRRVSLNCSVEPPRSAIQWRVWCECSADSSGSCRDTCSSLFPTIVNTGDRDLTGRVCASTGYDPAITYDNNFTVVRDQNNDTLVPFSVLSITVPQEFQQQNNTMLCLECSSQPFVHLQVLGTDNQGLATFACYQ